MIPCAYAQFYTLARCLHILILNLKERFQLWDRSNLTLFYLEVKNNEEAYRATRPCRYC